MNPQKPEHGTPPGQEGVNTEAISLWKMILSPQSIENSGGSISKSILNTSSSINTSWLFPMPAELRPELWMTAAYLKEKIGLEKVRECLGKDSSANAAAAAQARQISKECLSRKKTMAYEGGLISEALALVLRHYCSHHEKPVQLLYASLLKNEALIYAQVAEGMNFPKGTSQIYQLKILEFFVEACLCLAFSNLFQASSGLLEVLDAVFIEPANFVPNFLKRIASQLRPEIERFSKEFIAEKIPVNSKSEEFLNKMKAVTARMTEEFQGRFSQRNANNLKHFLLESLFPGGAQSSARRETSAEKNRLAKSPEKGSAVSKLQDSRKTYRGPKPRSTSNSSLSLGVDSGLSNGTRSGGDSDFSGEKTLKKNSSASANQTSLKTKEALKVGNFSKPSSRKIPRSPNSLQKSTSAQKLKTEGDRELISSHAKAQPNVLQPKAKLESKIEKNRADRAEEEPGPSEGLENLRFGEIEGVLKRNERIMSDIASKGNSSRLIPSEGSLKDSKRYFQSLLSKAKAIEALCNESLEIINMMERNANAKIKQRDSPCQKIPSDLSQRESNSGEILEEASSENFGRKVRRSRDDRKKNKSSGNTSMTSNAIDN